MIASLLSIFSGVRSWLSPMRLYIIGVVVLLILTTFALGLARIKTLTSELNAQRIELQTALTEKNAAQATIEQMNKDQRATQARLGVLENDNRAMAQKWGEKLHRLDAAGKGEKNATGDTLGDLNRSVNRMLDDASR